MPTANEPTNPPAAPAEVPSTTIDAARAALRAAESEFNKAVAEVRGGDDRDTGVIADKQLRVHFDAGLQQLKALPPSRERSLAITKIQEAIMWLGMDLKRLNDTRPYPSSYDPSTTTVEPTADGLQL